MNTDSTMVLAKLTVAVLVLSSPGSTWAQAGSSSTTAVAPARPARTVTLRPAERPLGLEEAAGRADSTFNRGLAWVPVAPPPAPSGPSVPTSIPGGFPANLASGNPNTVANASMQFNTNGTWSGISTLTGPISGTWLPAGGNPADFDITITSTAVSTLGGPNGSAARRTLGWTPMTSSVMLRQGTALGETVSDSLITLRDRTTGAVYQSWLMIQVEGACFADDTQVAMADGSWKRADLLAVGDVVKSFQSRVRPHAFKGDIARWTESAFDIEVIDAAVTALKAFDGERSVSINGVVTTPDHAHFAFDAEVKGFRWAGASDFVANRRLSLVKPDGELVRDVVAGFGGKKRFVRITTESGTLMVRDSVGDSVLTHNRSEAEVTDVVPALAQLPSFRVNGVGVSGTTESRNCTPAVCGY